MTKPERKQFILEKLRAAMSAIQADSRYDWTREPSETICTAAETLMKTVQKFIDSKADEDAIRVCYKSYVSHYAN